MYKNSHEQRSRCKHKDHSADLGYPWEKQRAWDWETWSSPRRHMWYLGLLNVSLHMRTHRYSHIIQESTEMVVEVKRSGIYWLLPTAWSSAAQLPGHKLSLLWHWSVSTAPVTLPVTSTDRKVTSRVTLFSWYCTQHPLTAWKLGAVSTHSHFPFKRD